jgi:hypothetical protein
MAKLLHYYQITIFIKINSLFMKNLCIIIVFTFGFLSCKSTSNSSTKVFDLPDEIEESSGIEITKKSDLIWTLQDSGNKSILYALNDTGEMVNKLAVLNEKNTDWEDLTSDDQGNIYIGDFGNNKNKRQDLSIYKINAADLNLKEVNVSQKINFFYPEQKRFPPKKKELFYDVEAFFIYGNNFYLFTKNRSSHFDGTTFLYRVPNRNGNFTAQKIGVFKTGGDFETSAITSADMSPDGEKVVLLSATKIWLFTEYVGDDFLNGKVREIILDSNTQKEGVCFKTNDIIYISDEKSNKKGGNVYELDLTK